MPSCCDCSSTTLIVSPSSIAFWIAGSMSKASSNRAFTSGGVMRLVLVEISGFRLLYTSDMYVLDLGSSNTLGLPIRRMDPKSMLGLVVLCTPRLGLAKASPVVASASTMFMGLMPWDTTSPSCRGKWAALAAASPAGAAACPDSRLTRAVKLTEQPRRTRWPPQDSLFCPADAPVP